MPSKFIDEGNGELKDVDALVASEDAPVVMLPRVMFDNMRDTFRNFLTLLRVKMADGRFSDRYCEYCVRNAATDHLVENVTCACACHAARKLLEQLEQM